LRNSYFQITVIFTIRNLPSEPFAIYAVRIISSVAFVTMPGTYITAAVRRRRSVPQASPEAAMDMKC